MKRFIVVVLLAFAFVSATQSQGFDHFWNPRPKVSQKMSLSASAASGVIEFKPELMVAGSILRKAEVGGGIQASFIKAAGFGLSWIHTYQDVNGANYSDYGFTLGFLVTGSTEDSPTFQPSITLQVGFANNLIQIGPGYELTTVRAPAQRLFLVVTFAWLPTLN